MPLNRWLMGLALAVGVGMLIAAQRIAVFMEGYVVGKRLQQLQEQETRVGWLDHQVVGSASPASLARQVQSRRMNLVAWSSLDALPPQPVASQNLLATAAADPDQLATGDNTSD